MQDLPFASLNDKLVATLKSYTDKCVEIVEDLAEENNLSETESKIAELITVINIVYKTKMVLESGFLDNIDRSSLSTFGVDFISNYNITETKEVNDYVIDYFQNFDKIKKDENLSLTNRVAREASRIINIEFHSNLYKHIKADEFKELSFSFNNSPDISKNISKKILAETTAETKHIKSLLDYKLYQMSLIFGLEFKKSFQHISEQSLLKAIFESMPKNDTVIDLYREIKIYMENKL
jgi:hypothetical protein